MLEVNYTIDNQIDGEDGEENIREGEETW